MVQRICTEALIRCMFQEVSDSLTGPRDPHQTTSSLIRQKGEYAYLEIYLLFALIILCHQLLWIKLRGKYGDIINKFSTTLFLVWLV
jgi:hypothetical protein